MRGFFVFLLALALVTLPASASDQSQRIPKHEHTLPHTDRLPGVDLADGLSQTTGIAISPLLGVTVMGVWRYYKTPESQRAQLPWYNSPYVWSVGICVLLVCLLKDILLGAFPPLKKPLDAVDTLENGVSGLLAATAVIPFIVAQMAADLPQAPVSLTSVPDLRLASSFSLDWLDFRYVFVPIAIIWFLLIWLANHAINVLILLSPFAVVDAALKLFKLFLLSLITATTWISPLLGTTVCIVVFYVAWRVAPWSFRLTVFGTLIGLDVLLPTRGRRRSTVEKPQGFLARQVEDVPIRTYGRLRRSGDGALIFSFRPWLVLRRRYVEIPTYGAIIAKGLLFPSLLNAANEQEKPRALIMFLPRFRSQEQSIALNLGIEGTREHALARSYVAIRSWAAETINFSKERMLPG